MNDVLASIDILILCLNFPCECDSDNIMRDGRDTSVRSNPQKYTCKDCRRTFYAHTSAFFRNLIPLICNILNDFFKNGIINLKHISKFFNCSNSYASTIVKEIMFAVNDSIEVKLT
ncbi:MAG: hypothetical protein ACTSRP_25355 [Candidatus Helarchaeota archaeon]